ncbi:MAG: hypothetical protein ABSD69_00780 [Candidatus Levyibacteriota bacterium]
MKLKLLKLPKLPKFPHLPRLNIEPVEKIMAFLIKHKISLTILISFIAFIVVAMWYRGYLLSKMNQTPGSNSDEIFNSTKADNSLPTITIPTPSSNNSVDNSAWSDDNYVVPTPFPTFAPLPTIAPLPVYTPTTTTSSTGNSNCTTGAGTPNSWYSDVYPNPSAASTNTGSITLYVYIRDCNENTAPVSDNLNVSLSSGDSNTKINGNSLPATVTTQNGVASFTVTSQVNGTVTLVVQDTTSNFTVTNINNNNPSITFNNSGSSSGNSNCSTANGVVNSWYSDVYPTSPVNAATGSTVTFTVDLRDCGKNIISSDNLTFSQTSNDSSLIVNGSAPPVSVQAQNGVATFNITSQNAGTDTFTIQDTTSNFAVTDTNNNNPSIVFSGSSTTTPTPTPTPSTASTAPANTPTPSLSNTPTPIATSGP